MRVRGGPGGPAWLDRWGFGLLLAALVLVWYAPSLGFGLIWDDPRYYLSLGSLTSLREIFTLPQPPTNQFYRPMAVLLGRLLTSPEGVVNAPLAHAVQIAAHLMASLAAAPVLRALGFGARHARLAALCFAILPLSYFGVAWEQNQQPQMVMWLLLSLLAAARYAEDARPAWLLLSSAAYAMALLFQEGAAPYVLVFYYLALLRRAPREPLTRQAWPLLHTGLAAAYALIWLSLPLQRGVTGLGFQPTVLAYFLQGLVFPLAWLLAPLGDAWPPAVWLGLFAAAWLALSLGLWKWGLGRTALAGTAWAALGILPLWAGLSWDYAQLGARLVYPASLGLAAVWGGWMAQAFSPGAWRRALGAAALVLVVGVSAVQWQQFQRLYAGGTAHLGRAVEVLAAEPGRRLLFVNFPDRLEIRPAAYPLGFWGITLAPVVQDLSDFARTMQGPSGADRSVAAFLTGASEREAWPYAVNLRGVNHGPVELVDAAVWADAVYLSDYLPGGALRLREAGAVRLTPEGGEPLAQLGEAVQVTRAEITVNEAGVWLRTVWRCLQPPQVDDTIFVHVWRKGAFVGSADGDSLGGLIPLWAWRPGMEIVDVRPLGGMDLAPGTYEVRAGIYNRTAAARYPAGARRAGVAVVEDAVVLGEFSVP